MGEVHTVPHSSIEAVKTLAVKFCSSFPPAKMISPVVSCVVAAKNRGTGRSPLDILTHELVLGEYTWTAEDGESLSSIPPIARRQPPRSAAVEPRSGQSGRTRHVGSEGEAWGVVLVSS